MRRQEDGRRDPPIGRERQAVDQLLVDFDRVGTGVGIGHRCGGGLLHPRSVGAKHRRADDGVVRRARVLFRSCNPTKRDVRACRPRNDRTKLALFQSEVRLQLQARRVFQQHRVRSLR